MRELPTLWHCILLTDLVWQVPSAKASLSGKAGQPTKVAASMPKTSGWPLKKGSLKLSMATSSCKLRRSLFETPSLKSVMHACSLHKCLASTSVQPLVTLPNKSQAHIKSWVITVSRGDLLCVEQLVDLIRNDLFCVCHLLVDAFALLLVLVLSFGCGIAFLGEGAAPDGADG